MIRVLVADENPRITQNLVRRLTQEGDITVIGSAADGEATFQQALRLQPDVILLDAHLPVMDGIQTTEMLAQHLPQAGVIMLSMESENESIRHAMLAGAREFLIKPFTGSEMVAAIRRVNSFQQRKGVSQQSPESHERRGKVIVVCSGKGGVGKSVIAVNLAVSLAPIAKTVLVDLALQFGDVSAILSLDQKRSIADLAASDAVADPEVIQQVLHQGPAGLSILPSPMRPELADLVTTAHVRALMEELRRTFDYIVVDTSPQLSDITLDALETADQLVNVSDLSVTSVKNAKLMLQVFEVLKVPAQNIALVLNHRDAVDQIDRSYAESFLKVSFAAELPYEAKLHAVSIGQGTPYVLSFPQSPISQQMHELAKLVGPGIAPASASSAGSSKPPSEPPPDESKKKKSKRLMGFARS